MKDLLKGLSSILKKPASDQPIPGSQKISDLTEDYYIEGAGEGEDELQEIIQESPPINLRAPAISKNLWKKVNEGRDKTEPIINNIPNIPERIIEQLPQEIISEELIIDKIAIEIVNNKEIYNSLSACIANILIKKITDVDTANPIFNNSLNNEKYYDHAIKFLESLQPLIKSELENFRSSFLEEPI